MWLRLILGVVYLAMAAGQVISWTAMPGILGAYQVGGPAAMQLLTAAVITGQLACGMWFVARPRSATLTPVWIYTVVSVIWTALGVQVVRCWEERWWRSCWWAARWWWDRRQSCREPAQHRLIASGRVRDREPVELPRYGL
jgi:hypothetical protein